MTKIISHTHILDNLEKIKQLDKDGALASIQGLADQIKDVHEQVKKVSVNFTKPIKNVVVAGMGGSGLGPQVIKYLYKDQLTVPLEIVNSYSLPAYVDQNTLVLLSSYSGNTEEILSCAKEAEKKKAQIMIICTGKDLAQIAKDKHYPALVFKPTYNPSNQPRMAIGYSIFGIIGLFEKAKLITLTEAELKEVLVTILKTSEQCDPKLKSDKNKAKLLAFSLFDKRPILLGCEFLQGALHTAQNQFNENAKTYADFKMIPEINHHLMEGLKFPKANDHDHLFLFFNSTLYHSRNQKRISLTKQVVEQNDIETMEIKLESESKLTQVFELITFMAFAHFYLAMLYQIDPCPIPYVDWFKENLK